MTETNVFASLTPTLLARKGGAKPAMRPQLQPLYNDSLARDLGEPQTDADLGWNDMGDDFDAAGQVYSADVVPIQPEIVAVPRKAPRPPVVRQREQAAHRVLGSTERRSALADGRRAAFTLRVDGERHLKLRLACTIRNRSAQQLVTEALDRLLDELPELGSLADQVAQKR